MARISHDIKEQLQKNIERNKDDTFGISDMISNYYGSDKKCINIIVYHLFYSMYNPITAGYWAKTDAEWFNMMLYYVNVFKDALLKALSDIESEKLKDAEKKPRSRGND